LKAVFSRAVKQQFLPPPRKLAAGQKSDFLTGTTEKYQCPELLRICLRFEAAKRRQTGFWARLCGKKMRTKARQDRAFRLFRGALISDLKLLLNI